MGTIFTDWLRPSPYEIANERRRREALGFWGRRREDVVPMGSLLLLTLASILMTIGVWLLGLWKLAELTMSALF